MHKKISDILSQLSNADPLVREAALDDIGTLKPAHALELIVPFLSDTIAEVRETAACNLGEIQDERAIGHLIQSVRQEKHEKVRFYALNALSYYHSSAILDCLVEEVSRGELSLMSKQTVAEQLGNYESQKAIDALIMLLQNKDPYVLVPTVDALFKLNQPRLQSIWRQILLTNNHPHLGQVPLLALAELEQVEPIEIALSFTASHEAEVRRGGTHGLASLDDKRVIPHLIELARHDKAECVQDMAILGLTEYNTPQVYEYYREAIFNQSLSSFARELMTSELSELDIEETQNSEWLICSLDENERDKSSKNSLDKWNGAIFPSAEKESSHYLGITHPISPSPLHAQAAR